MCARMLSDKGVGMERRDSTGRVFRLSLQSATVCSKVDKMSMTSVPIANLF